MTLSNVLRAITEANALIEAAAKKKKKRAKSAAATAAEKKKKQLAALRKKPDAYKKATGKCPPGFQLGSNGKCMSKRGVKALQKKRAVAKKKKIPNAPYALRPQDKKALQKKKALAKKKVVPAPIDFGKAAAAYKEVIAALSFAAEALDDAE